MPIPKHNPKGKKNVGLAWLMQHVKVSVAHEFPTMMQQPVDNLFLLFLEDLRMLDLECGTDTSNETSVSRMIVWLCGMRAKMEMNKWLKRKKR